MVLEEQVVKALNAEVSDFTLQAMESHQWSCLKGRIERSVSGDQHGRKPAGRKPICPSSRSFYSYSHCSNLDLLPWPLT